MVIKRVQGDTYSISIQIVDENDSPMDLTGCTVYFTVKRNIEDSDASALISVDVTSHVDPVNGFTDIPLTANDTNIEGEFYYDIKTRTTSGEIRSAFKDRIIFASHVTLRV